MSLDLMEEELELDDDFQLVLPSQYQPELEQRVKDYMMITATLPTNTIKYDYVKVPEFREPESAREFWVEQIRRCKEGYNGMAGKMYFFYNFCWIENIGKGRIRPQFRVIDNEWFKYIEDAQKSRKYGIVCVKRRRVGASWKEAADVLHDCLFMKNFHVGMNSKSERDSILLFRKVKFLYNALPDALRARTTSSTKMFLDFSYIDPSNKKKLGNNSDITVVAPTDSAYEGMMLNKLIIDEAGKIVNLPQIWSYAEDCLMQETRREGLVIIFGTSGDVGKEGAGLMEMWDNSEVYNLRRFFFAGYMGLAVDEYGNDRKEDCIRWIVYERRRREKLNQKFYNDFIQKYPMTVEEAFTVNGEIGLGDIVKLKSQRASLVMNPVAATRGVFVEEDGKVAFRVDGRGPCIIYEHPEALGKYISGCDPADIDDVYEESSDLSMYIMALQDGMKRPRIVFEYTDRPRELNNYYYQCMMALRYYNDCKILIERNKGGRMISYFNDHGYKYLLMTQPQEAQRLVSTRMNQIGIHMNAWAKEYLRGSTSEYVDDYSDCIPSIKLIDEMIVYGTKNTDRAMAFGITIIALKEVHKPYLQNKKGKYDSRLPKIKYTKDIYGNIRLQRPSA
jgi:hypothetical protein